jgi:hypothetical protein
MNLFAAGVLAFSFAAGACVHSQPPPYSIDAATRQKVVDQLGEDVARDFDTVLAAGRAYEALPYPKPASSYDPGEAVACVSTVIAAVGHHNHGRVAQERTAMEQCAQACSAESFRNGSPFSELARKYAARCGPTSIARMHGSDALRDFDMWFGRIQNRRASVELIGAIPQLREDLQTARAGAAATDASLDERVQQLDRFEATHRDDLKRVAAFVAREDVQAVQAEIHKSQERIKDLNAMRRENDAYMEDLHLQGLEKRYGKLAHDAGL